MNKSKNKKEWILLSMVIPSFIIYGLFCLYPFLTTFYYSFTDYSKRNPINLSWVGFSNYITVFQNEQLIASIGNSIKYAILMTVLQSLLAIPLAVLLDRNLKFKNTLRMIFFMPAVFSTLVVGYLWNFIMSASDMGLINKGLMYLGLEKINFLGDAKIALYSIIFTQLWQWVGWAMVIYLANLQSIPKELYEATEIDGGNAWQSFIHITLPMLNPSVTMVFVTSLVGGLKVFDIIFTLTQGGPGYATETIMTAMIKKAMTDGFYGVGSAFGVIFFILVMIMSSILMKFLKRWEEQIA